MQRQFNNPSRQLKIK